jgi:hypothetical protein
MNHPNRGKTARTKKTAEAIIGALESQGVQITPAQQAAAISALIEHEEKKGLDLDSVRAAIDSFDLNAAAYSKGRYSAGIKFFVGEGRNEQWAAQIDVSCAGEGYWITVTTDQDRSGRGEKWYMPRDEVCHDRADKFLINVLKNAKGNFGQLNMAVSVVLGIDSSASIGYTRDVTATRRAQKNGSTSN